MSNLWFAAALLPQGWEERVRISAADGRISALAVGVDPALGDERHGIALPGLPNLHSHAFQRGLAGLTECRGPGPDSFWSWRELMYQFVERIGPEELEALSAFAFAEMLEAGFTHVGEFHYLHHDRDGAPYADPGELAARIAAAAEASGIGLTLLPTFYAHGGFGGRPPGPRQRRFVSDPAGFARLLESSGRALRALQGAQLGVAAHSLRAVTPEELRAVVSLAAGGVIHIHIAEQLKEVEDCRAWSGGRRPIEWLLAEERVDERWCLVHATHASDAELAAIAASGAVVGLCPSTEASLGDGIFAAAAYLGAAGRAGVGSDSNVRLDAAEELRLLEYSQRLRERARNVLALRAGASTGAALFSATLAGGAQALGLGAGAALRPGASLDLLTLNASDPALAGRRGDELLDTWIFSAGRSLIDCVWRAGRRVVSAGRHHARERLAARYVQVLERLRA
jgi:formimidoylglutamate deiminase